MKLRAITLFLPSAARPLDFRLAGERLQAARTAAVRAGLDVQTLRLALDRPERLVTSLTDLPDLAREAASAASAAGIDYVSLGAIDLATLAEGDVPQIVAALHEPTVFVSGRFADRSRGVSLDGARRAAAVIQALSTVEPHGFSNLQFAATANCPPGVPFFPAGYAGDRAGFAVAWEAADLAVEAFERARDAADALDRLVQAIEACGSAVEAWAQPIEAPDFAFLGSDCSLAPFPASDRSIGHAAESLGLPWFGAHGSLAVAAILTEASRRARLRRTGFSGLMLPVLEDNVLAERAGAGQLGLTDLLLVSAVCGTGLDVCPLPGDASIEQLTAVLLDVGTLAVVLDKPLTARLMPIPGASAGDPVEFDFGYFAPSRVMALDGDGLHGLLEASRGTILANPASRSRH